MDNVEDFKQYLDGKDFSFILNKSGTNVSQQKPGDMNDLEYAIWRFACRFNGQNDSYPKKAYRTARRWLKSEYPEMGIAKITVCGEYLKQQVKEYVWEHVDPISGLKSSLSHRSNPLDDIL